MGSSPKQPPLPPRPPPAPDLTDEVIRQVRSAALRPVGRTRQSTFIGDYAAYGIAPPKRGGP